MGTPVAPLPSFNAAFLSFFKGLQATFVYDFYYVAINVTSYASDIRNLVLYCEVLYIVDLSNFTT